MIKLAIFTPTLEGGVGRVITNLANGLLSKKYNIDLLVPNASGPYLSELSSQIRLINFKISRTLKALLPLVNYLKKEKPQILLSVSFHANVIAIWAKFISRSNTKVVCSEHIALNQALTNLNFFKKIVMRRLVKRFYRYADKIVCVSEEAAEKLNEIVKLPSDKIICIYNPIVDDFLYERAKQKITHPWFSDKKPLILGVGRLTRQKDFSTLIKAFAIVRKHMDAKLIILGEGEEREKLEKLIAKLDLKDHVDLLGFVENPYPFFKQADVYVLSSKWEGLPTTLIEAMALGVPVVATSCESGPKEVLNNGEYGLLVPIEDEQSLASAILKLLKNYELSKLFSFKGRERAKDFSIKSAIEKYDVIFKKLINQ